MVTLIPSPFIKRKPNRTAWLNVWIQNIRIEICLPILLSMFWKPNRGHCSARTMCVASPCNQTVDMVMLELQVWLRFDQFLALGQDFRSRSMDCLE